jgi:hypothetical protein
MAAQLTEFINTSIPDPWLMPCLAALSDEKIMNEFGYFQKN